MEKRKIRSHQKIISWNQHIKITSLEKTLLSRNFCQKCVRVNFLKFPNCAIQTFGKLYLSSIIFFSDFTLLPKYQGTLHILPGSRQTSVSGDVFSVDFIQQFIFGLQFIYQFHYLLCSSEIISAKNHHNSKKPIYILSKLCFSY